MMNMTGRVYDFDSSLLRIPHEMCILNPDCVEEKNRTTHVMVKKLPVLELLETVIGLPLMMVLDDYWGTFVKRLS